MEELIICPALSNKFHIHADNRFLHVYSIQRVVGSDRLEDILERTSCNLLYGLMANREGETSGSLFLYDHHFLLYHHVVRGEAQRGMQTEEESRALED